MPYSMSPANGRVNRVEKLIINLDTALPLTCNWDECDRRARTPYQVVQHEHAGTCTSEVAQWGRHVRYAFCSEGHRLYWLNASGPNAHRAAAENRGRIYGFKPAGVRNRI